MFARRGSERGHPRRSRGRMAGVTEPSVLRSAGPEDPRRHRVQDEQTAESEGRRLPAAVHVIAFVAPEEGVDPSPSPWTTRGARSRCRETRGVRTTSSRSARASTSSSTRPSIPSSSTTSPTPSRPSRPARSSRASSRASPSSRTQWARPSIVTKARTRYDGAIEMGTNLVTIEIGDRIDVRRPAP